MAPCCVCGVDFPKAHYSKAQWSKKDLRKCRSCVASAVAAEEVCKPGVVPGTSIAVAVADSIGPGASETAATVLQQCAPPCARVYFSACSEQYPSRNVIIFGGERTEGRGRKAETKFYKDTYRFCASDGSWRCWPKDARSPSPRSGHHSCFCSALNIMYTFGGEWSNAKGTRFVHYNELWQLDLNNDCWSLVATSGEVPSARSGMRLVAPPGREIVLMFGGFADDGKARFFNDLHLYDCISGAWSRVQFGSACPPKRSSFQWVAHEDRVCLFGGYCKIAPQKKSKVSRTPKEGEPTDEDEFELLGRGVTYTDLWELQLSEMTWRRVKASGQGPSPRLGFGLAKFGSKCLLFGGVHDNDIGDDLQSTFYNDVYEFDLRTLTWTPLLLGVAIGPDAAETSSEEDEEDEAPQLTIVDLASNDSGCLHEASNLASEPAAETNHLEYGLQRQDAHDVAECRPMPSARAASQVVTIENGLIVFGGMCETRQGEIALRDTWRLDLQGQSGWTKVSESKS